MQSLHPALPGADLYFPARQLTQLPPSGPVKPMRHRQSVAAPLAGGLEENSGQLTHAASPAVSLYIDAAHAVHGPPIGPVVPTGQYWM